MEADITGITVLNNVVYTIGIYINGNNGNAAAFDAVGNAVAWNPNFDNQPYAILSFGNTVYVAGAFTSAGGEQRSRLAAFDANGNLTAWAPYVDRTIVAQDALNNTLHVGGYGLLEGIDLGSGAVVAW